MHFLQAPICHWFFLHQLNLGNTTTNNNFQELCGTWWGGEGWEGRSGETRFSLWFDFVRKNANENPPTPAGFFQVSQKTTYIWLVRSTDEDPNAYFCSNYFIERLKWAKSAHWISLSQHGWVMGRWWGRFAPAPTHHWKPSSVISVVSDDRWCIQCDSWKRGQFQQSLQTK